MATFASATWYWSLDPAKDESMLVTVLGKVHGGAEACRCRTVIAAITGLPHQSDARYVAVQTH